MTLGKKKNLGSFVYLNNVGFAECSLAPFVQITIRKELGPDNGCLTQCYKHNTESVELIIF